MKEKKRKRIKTIFVRMAVIMGIFMLPSTMTYASGNDETDTYEPYIELIPETPDLDNANSEIYGYYNCSSDDTVSVSAEISDVDENGSYSGLKIITYQVLCDGKETQNGTLFSFEKDATSEEPTYDQLAESSEYSGTISIDASKNNSSNVKVIVSATDQAGNSSEKCVKLDIDVTAPTIAISYDNNSAENERYFDTVRIATIVITERTSHFDSDDVKISITAVSADGSIVTDATANSMISAWKTTEKDTADAAIHTATITYSKDANYTFSISCKDAAGNVSQTADTGNSAAPYKFTVDTSAPTGTVIYISAEGRTDTKSSLLKNLTFGFYSADSIRVLAASNDATSPIASVQYYKTANTTAMTVGQLDALSSSNWKRSNGLYITSDEQLIVYFKITDRTGNYTYISTDGMIVDRTIPVIAVSYNNTDVLNNNYYKSSRIATISITEHNFDAAGVTITASENGNEMTLNPSWSSSGDTHTATVFFDSDALYTFDVAYTDMAGNDAADYTEDIFYVDQIKPEIVISGVTNGSANTETVAPNISVTDKNYDSSGIRITLEGMLYGEKGSYSISDITDGQTFTFDNIETDDIYVLTVSATDKAGNVLTESIRFSVNRNGSTYDISALKAINQKYLKSDDMTNLVITEINPNQLGNVVVTLYKNGEAGTLIEGEDYTCNTECYENGWYYYTYTIFREVFADDGTYSIKISSVDEAENPSENVLDMESEIEFIVDNTEPTIILTNIEEEKTYNSETYEVIMAIKDNMALTQVEVILDGEEGYRIWEGDTLQEVLDENGDFRFEIAESDSTRSLSVVATDAAGNVRTIGVDRFWVTTNTWVNLHAKLPLLVNIFAVLVTLIGLSVFLRFFVFIPSHQESRCDPDPFPSPDAHRYSSYSVSDASDGQFRRHEEEMP